MLLCLWQVAFLCPPHWWLVPLTLWKNERPWRKSKHFPVTLSPVEFLHVNIVTFKGPLKQTRQPWRLEERLQLWWLWLAVKNSPEALLGYEEIVIIKRLIWFHSGEISDLGLQLFLCRTATAIWQLPSSLEFHLPWLLVLTLRPNFSQRSDKLTAVLFFHLASYLPISLFSSMSLRSLPTSASRQVSRRAASSGCDLTPIWSSQLPDVSFRSRMNFKGCSMAPSHLSLVKGHIKPVPLHQW